MKTSLNQFVCLIVCSTAIVPAALAATKDWNGGTSGAWNLGANWTPSGVPVNDLTSDIARFNQASYSFQPSADSGRQIAGLVFGNATAGVTLTTATNFGRLTVGGSGVLMDTTSAAVNIGSTTNQGMNLGASMDLTNNSSSLLRIFTLTNASNVTARTVTINGSGSGGVQIDALSNNVDGLVNLVVATSGGVTTLTNANSFSGETTLTSGVLALNNMNSLQNSSLNTAGTGTVTTTATTLSLGGLRGSRNLSSVITSGFGSVTALTLNPLSGTSSYSGVVSNGAGATTLTKVGAGTQVLEGANTYTGVTTISTGVLGVTSLGNASAASTLGQSSSASTNLVLNGGTLQLTGSTTSTQSTDRLFRIGVNGATVDSSAGVGSSMNFTNTGTIDASNVIGNRTLTLTGNRSGSITSVIGQRNGTDSLTSVVKSGVGTWTLGGSNTYTGSTVVSAGTLLVNGSIGGSGATVGNGGTLGGNGSVNTSVVVQNGGTLSPGNSPGLLTQGATTLEAGGNYNWQLHNAAGTAGTGFDSINLTSGSVLTITASAGNEFKINLWTLSAIAPDVNGDAINFSDASNYSWTLISTNQAIVGFNATDFFINTGAANGAAGFDNSFTGTFSVVLADGGTDLVLVYTAIPEPSTWLLLAAGLTWAVIMRRRRA